MFELARIGNLQGIWFYAGMYALLVCGYSLIFQARTRRWNSTKGDLIELEIEKFGAKEFVKSNQDYITEASYRYTVNGKEYLGTRVSPWIFVASHNARGILQKQMKYIHRYPDGRVKVFYNPAKPRKSYLIIPGFVGMIVTSIAAIGPLVLYYIRFYG